MLIYRAVYFRRCALFAVISAMHMHDRFYGRRRPCARRKRRAVPSVSPWSGGKFNDRRDDASGKRISPHRSGSLGVIAVEVPACIKCRARLFLFSRVSLKAKQSGMKADVSTVALRRERITQVGKYLEIVKKKSRRALLALVDKKRAYTRLLLIIA